MNRQEGLVDGKRAENMRLCLCTGHSSFAEEGGGEMIRNNATLCRGHLARHAMSQMLTPALASARPSPPLQRN